MSDDRSAEELIQSALSSAFVTPVSIAPAATPPTQPSSEAVPETSTSTVEPLVSQEDLAKYEEERLALEQSWKEESAVQRREAEERRERIAAERAARGESWEGTKTDDSIKGPPNPIFNPKNGETKGYPGEPSIVDARGVVSGEPSGTRQAEAQVSPPTTATLEHSQRWEDIEAESLESSYPSLSYPEQSQSESASGPSSEHGPPRARTHGRAAKHPSSKSKPSESEKRSAKAEEGQAGSVPVPVPVPTLSLFDSRLSTSSRIVALLSSLSINLFLPFVNGVMLGFGEIFARNMAARFFGWKLPETPETRTRAPGGAATAVGVRAAGSESDRRRR